MIQAAGHFVGHFIVLKHVESFSVASVMAIGVFVLTVRDIPKCFPVSNQKA